jgi:signal transduction histidine kinase
MASRVVTFYAPAERAHPREIQRLSQKLSAKGFFGGLLDHVPDIVLILNPQRQIVYANRAAMEALGTLQAATAEGMRPGELLQCKNADAGEGGCGTSANCRFCGVVSAILSSQQGKAAVEDCHLTVRRSGHEESLDLRVWASPAEFNGESLTLLTMANVAQEKRRLFLERVFLHDLANTAMALREFWSLLNDPATEPRAREQFMETLGHLAERMVDEVKGHQLLVAAENNQLQLNLKRLDSLALLRQLFRCYNRPEILNQRWLELAPESHSVEFHSDETLMVRVLSNMIKNAIEASPEGATVTLGCRRDGDRVSFSIHNHSCMRAEIQAQVFQRSFSTKGTGRGLGTYSMKYFTERYLGGRVSFTSSEEAGTTFTATYPLTLP